MGKGFVYKCPKCGREEELLSGVGFMSPVETDMERESRLAVTVKAPIRVSILQRCDCGATMHRIRSGKDMVCPACREPMQKTGLAVAVLWD